jgi:hypothetical protein
MLKPKPKTPLKFKYDRVTKNPERRYLCFQGDRLKLLVIFTNQPETMKF